MKPILSNVFSNVLSHAKVRPNDFFMAVVIIAVSAALAWVEMRRTDSHALKISNFGPRQIPAESISKLQPFAMWLIVEHVTSAGRVFVDEKPVASVVDAEAHAITANIPVSSFADDGKVSVRVVDDLDGRSTESVLVTK